MGWIAIAKNERDCYFGVRLEPLEFPKHRAH